MTFACYLLSICCYFLSVMRYYWHRPATTRGTLKALEHWAPARYYVQLIDFLETNGTPCRDALSAAQVRILNDPEAKLTVGQIEALVADLMRLTGRNDLGFELGRLIKLNSHDVLGYAFLSCPTIDHILRLASRYYRLVTPMFSVRYERHATHAEIMFQPVLAMRDLHMRFQLEVLAVSFHMQLMAVTQGRQSNYDVYVSMPAPPHIQRYRELFPAHFHFGEDQLPGVRIKIGTELFDQPLPMADLRVLNQAEMRCRLLLQEFSKAGKLSGWVSMMLREAEDCQPTLVEVARILNISPRTLDRHLDNEGTSFRDLAASIRNDRACQLLADGKHAVSQVAYRLGYTDLANFSRWFKRLNGVSPTTYMAQASENEEEHSPMSK